MTQDVAAWTALLDRLYPPANASDWDNVGLQVGAADWPVERVIVALDVTADVVDEAAREPATLLVAHHPLLFRPLRALTTATVAGGVALRAAGTRVAVFAAHTNLDVATDGAGTSEPVMRVLEIDDVRPLTAGLRESAQVKLVTFAPHDIADALVAELSASGAGVIGNYDRCSFRTAGTGTFRPLPGSDPLVGSIGRDTAESEVRIEMVVPRARLARVVRALRGAHPYDEAAYDLYPLVDGAEAGFGLIGDLAAPASLGEVAARVRDGLPSPCVRMVGDPDTPVTRVASVGGAGEAYVEAALAAGADVLVTGDVKHHAALDARSAGMALLDAGHHATEAAAMPALIDRLARAASAEGLSAPVLASDVSTVPWRCA